jgi:pilus assembly protein TadC
MTLLALTLLLGAATALVLPGGHRVPGRGTRTTGRRPGRTPVPSRRTGTGHRRGRRPRDDRVDAAEAALAAVLVVAAVDAGVAVPTALQAVADQVGGPVGARLDAAVRLLRVGADAAAALAPLRAESAAAPMARGLQAALESGASPVPLLEAAAAAQRDRARSALVRRARGLGSRAALPLSLCFLPAFVLVGVVPLVLGGLGTVLGGR